MSPIRTRDMDEGERNAIIYAVVSLAALLAIVIFCLVVFCCIMKKQRRTRQAQLRMQNDEIPYAPPLGRQDHSPLLPQNQGYQQGGNQVLGLQDHAYKYAANANNGPIELQGNINTGPVELPSAEPVEATKSPAVHTKSDTN